jgi:hypothetical protein
MRFRAKIMHGKGKMAAKNQASARDELKKLVINQKKVFLPPEASDSALYNLHEAVSQYDQLISQVVIEAIQGNTTGSAVEGETVNQAHEAVELALASPEISGNQKVDFYRSYVDRLDHMLQLANQVLEGQ